LSPETALAGLFASAFLAATLLPGGSEVVLAALLANDPAQRWPALTVATVGNTLGSLTSYAIGRLFPRPKIESRSLALVRRYGVAALLFAWLPLIGDALCVASGWLRQNLLTATAAIAAGKIARYHVIAEGVRWLGS
jgi:membrane protein YqaA with SNARE-associated domain